MKDLTAEVPVRRMSVARGRLVGFPAQARADVGACEAAARLAVKQADRLLPDVHPFQLGHIDLLFDASDEALELTVTVQGHARDDLDSQALLGVVVALLTARHQLDAPDARLVDVGLVQNVVA